MSVSVALDHISFVSQPSVLHLAEFLLYRFAYGVVCIFLRGGLGATEVDLMEKVFLIQ